MKEHSFARLFATNFFGVLNDNFLKSLAAFVALGWVAGERMQGVFMGVTAGALVLPYIFCSPLADRLAALAPKRTILVWAKLAELPIMLVAAIGFHLESPATVVAAVLLMGLQSSLYSPAKYALVRDIGGSERISTGMGGMEAVAFAGVLAGTVLASLAADRLPQWTYHAILFGNAAAGLACALSIRVQEETKCRLHSINPVRFFLRARRMTLKTNGLGATITTLGVFWWLAATLQMGLVVYGRQVLGLDAVHTAAILSAAAVGIVFGSWFAGLVDARVFLLGWTIPTALAAAAILGILFFAPLSPFVFTALIGILAFDLGFFKLPLDAEIQRRVKGPRLNTVLAYFNQVTFMFMLLASATYALANALFGPRAFLAILALAMLAAPFYFTLRHRKVLAFVGKWILAQRYNVTRTGMALAPDENTAWLVLPNHPAIVDPMLVASQLYQVEIRPLADEAYLARGSIASRVLRTFDALAVPDLRRKTTRAGASAARRLCSIVTETLASGKSVIFYPSGHIWTEPREEIGTRQLAYNVCKNLPEGVRVVAVRTSGLWGSIWSRKGRTASPAFAPTLVKSILLWPLCAIFRRKRNVQMHFEDVTARVRKWSGLTRLEFNRHLEAWYNE
ncbi:MAG: hypothetical protein IJ802_04840 [Kiritimatiellae bacterium]|nr:hypothetical protein [Kiritimatiellia bacterium]